MSYKKSYRRCKHCSVSVHVEINVDKPTQKLKSLGFKTGVHKPAGDVTATPSVFMYSV